MFVKPFIVPSPPQTSAALGQVLGTAGNFPQLEMGRHCAAPCLPCSSGGISTTLLCCCSLILHRRQQLLELASPGMPQKAWADRSASHIAFQPSCALLSSLGELALCCLWMPLVQSKRELVPSRAGGVNSPPPPACRTVQVITNSCPSISQCLGQNFPGCRLGWGLLPLLCLLPGTDESHPNGTVVSGHTPAGLVGLEMWQLGTQLSGFHGGAWVNDRTLRPLN